MTPVRQQQKPADVRRREAAPVPRPAERGRAAPSPRHGLAPVSPRHGLAPVNGLPEPLKTNIEAMSGLEMDDVRVHRNSSEPARLGAYAYTQGNEIHLGAGQETHLPHEAWHVVQQKQGRVAATAQMKGVAVSDDVGLEREADRMGAEAATSDAAPRQHLDSEHRSTRFVVQRKLVQLTAEQIALLVAPYPSADPNVPIPHPPVANPLFDTREEYAEYLQGLYLSSPSRLPAASTAPAPITDSPGAAAASGSAMAGAGLAAQDPPVLYVKIATVPDRHGLGGTVRLFAKVDDLADREAAPAANVEATDETMGGSAAANSSGAGGFGLEASSAIPQSAVPQADSSEGLQRRIEDRTVNLYDESETKYTLNEVLAWIGLISGGAAGNPDSSSSGSASSPPPLNKIQEANFADIGLSLLTGGVVDLEDSKGYGRIEFRFTYSGGSVYVNEAYERLADLENQADKSGLDVIPESMARIAKLAATYREADLPYAKERATSDWVFISEDLVETFAALLETVDISSGASASGGSASSGVSAYAGAGNPGPPGRRGIRTGLKVSEPSGSSKTVPATYRQSAGRGDRGSGQSAVMGASAGQYAASFGLSKSPGWEWLHLRASSLGGKNHQNNLVAGTSQANTQMIPYERILYRMTKKAKPNKRLSVTWTAHLLDIDGPTHVAKQIDFRASWNCDLPAEPSEDEQQLAAAVDGVTVKGTEGASFTKMDRDLIDFRYGAPEKKPKKEKALADQSSETDDDSDWEGGGQELGGGLPDMGGEGAGAGEQDGGDADLNEMREDEEEKKVQAAPSSNGPPSPSFSWG